MSLDYAYVAHAFILHRVYPHGRNYSSVCCSFSSAPNFFFFHQCKRHRFDPWGQKDVLEEETATHSSILAWNTGGAWWATVHGVANELDTTRHAHIFISGYAGFCCCLGFSLVTVNQDCSLLQYEGFSFLWLLLLQIMGFRGLQ